MTTDSQLLTTTPKNKNKNKLSKQLEQEQNHRNGDHMEVYQRGGGQDGGKGTGNKKHNWWVQNRQGEVKSSIGNGEAKELTGMTYGHEIRARGGGCWWEGLQGRGE